MHRHRALRHFVLVVALLLVGMAPAAASAAPLLGVQADGVSATTSSKAIDAQVKALASAHATAVRVEVDWSALEPRVHGVYDAHTLANLDRLIGGLAARGIKTVLFVDRTPCWASSAPDKGSCAGSGANRFDVTRYGPSDPQMAVPVSTFLVTRYGGKLAAYEVWNEPDQVNQKYWAGPNKIERYVALMKALYPALKQAAPTLPVIAGSFVGTNGAWLKALYAAGAKGFYDGLSVHFYDLPLQGLKTTHQVQVANGDSAPLWLTEFGFTSCLTRKGPTFRADHPCVSRAAQSRGLVDVFRAAESTSWIAAAIMYTLHDQSRDYQFGLLDREGRRKPSFAAVRSTLSGRAGRLTRPSLHLRASGGRLVASGSGSVADVYLLQVYRGGTLRWKAYLRTTGSGSYGVAVPASLGRSGLRVTIRSTWSNAATTRHS
jgi:polysaccharide biosynthesis protein PslG